jgi:hypothetical protein
MSKGPESKVHKEILQLGYRCWNSAHHFVAAETRKKYPMSLFS